MGPLKQNNGFLPPNVIYIVAIQILFNTENQAIVVIWSENQEIYFYFFTGRFLIFFSFLEIFNEFILNPQVIKKYFIIKHLGCNFGYLCNLKIDIYTKEYLIH